MNASVPKTLVQYMIRWAAASDIFGLKASAVLYDILDTEISPELVPGADGDKPGQSTEAAVGPYELQDFNIYYITRYGFLPSKVAFLAWNAWHDRTVGEWPEILPGTRHQYTLAEIKHWLALFILRFFKLSCIQTVLRPRTDRRSAPAARCPPAGTIAHRATARRRPGWTICGTRPMRSRKGIR